MVCGTPTASDDVQNTQRVYAVALPGDRWHAGPADPQRPAFGATHRRGCASSTAGRRTEWSDRPLGVAAIDTAAVIEGGRGGFEQRSLNVRWRGAMGSREPGEFVAAAIGTLVCRVTSDTPHDSGADGATHNSRRLRLGDSSARRRCNVASLGQSRAQGLSTDGTMGRVRQLANWPRRQNDFGCIRT